MNQSNFSLIKPKFTPLPLQAIQPKGWLKSQLQLQADGLSGHLDQFWPDISRSRWFGGDQEGWERAPYWLDGVIPLAYLIDDQQLISRIKNYIDYIVEHQDPGGWLGPKEMAVATGLYPHQFHDAWSQFLIDKVLIQYYDLTQDQAAFAAIEKNLRCLSDRAATNPLFNWGQFRWFEALLTIFWMYEHKPQQWLVDLAIKLHAQGFNWKDYFDLWPEKPSTNRGKWSYMSHVVNNAMAIKAHGLWYRISGKSEDRDHHNKMIRLLDEYHGLVMGIFSGDECLAGKSPTQGTELCAVVEYAFSLETLLSILGEPALGDRLEKVIFNALPATLLPDMWSHQYDQQVNQVECSIKPRPWTTNGADANIFGLEPNYGCCTANFSQGWPKFAASLWMIANQGEESEGLAAVAYAPGSVSHKIRGNQITIHTDTEYPFRDTIEFVLDVQKPMEFPLSFRVPGWTDRPACILNHRDSIEAQPGTFLTVVHEWHSGDTLTLKFPMKPKVVRHEKGSISIERGPLVYGLKIEEEFRPVNIDLPLRNPPHCDWEIYPKSPWNYGLRVSAETIDDDLFFEERPLGALPFSPKGAPGVIKVKGKRISDWQMVNGSAGELPESPVFTSAPLEDLVLIPYGCTNLRIAQFPVLNSSPRK